MKPVWGALVLFVFACKSRETDAPPVMPARGWDARLTVETSRPADAAVAASAQAIEPGEPPPSMVVVTSEPAFYIDRTEVTIGAYRECVVATICPPPEAERWKQWDARRAVTLVTVDDARAYCAYRGKRLPTRREWMRAALGVDGRKYPWGDQPPSCDLAAVGHCVHDVANVGSKPRDLSPFGALDMAGNVYEFADDDPSGPERHVDATVMGAVYSTPFEQVAEAFEGRGGGGGYAAANERMGFRCARTPR